MEQQHGVVAPVFLEVPNLGGALLYVVGYKILLLPSLL
jgi:hypothetical protein